MGGFPSFSLSIYALYKCLPFFADGGWNKIQVNERITISVVVNAISNVEMTQVVYKRFKSNSQTL